MPKEGSPLAIFESRAPGKQPPQRMKRHGVRATVLLWLLLVVSPLGAQTQVRVGLYQNSPKVDYTANGVPQGIFVDILEAIARREGWSLQYVPGTFAQGMARLAAGEIDLMPDVALTAGREKAYAFHDEPVLSSWNQVYARRGSGIRSLLDLNGKQVAVLAGSTQQDFFLQMADDFSVKVKLVTLPDYPAAFAAVAAGSADAVVTNPYFGVRHAAHVGLEDTAIIFKPSGLYFAARGSGDPDLLATIDRNLRALKNDPSSVYYGSMRQWTGHAPASVVPPWLKWGLLGAALLLAASLLWAATLRRTAARLRASEQRQRELAAEVGQVLGRLQARTADLQRANDELQTFSYSVSHDLRAPLATIAGFSGKLLVLNESRLDAGSLAMLRRVLAAARRMGELIDDLLALSQVSQQEIQLQDIDLSALATEIVDDLRQAQPERQVEVSIAPGMLLHGDPSLVRIALENLIGNAWKFTSGTGAARIEIGMDGHEGVPACCVRDNGAGFDMHYADKLFAPFQRLHSEAQFAGSGIGLSIVQRIVARHGGRVWALSRPGEGAAFFFSLPAQAARAP